MLLVTAVFNYENDTCLQAHVLIDKKAFRKTQHVDDLIKEIKLVLDNELVTTDEYHTDQLLIFMALADGTSTIICEELSKHSLTVLELLKMFIPSIKISIEDVSKDEHKAQKV